METSVVLYGASGHCKVIIDMCEQSNIVIKSIVDDNPKKEGVLGREISASSGIHFEETDNIVLSIGNNNVRKMLSDKIRCNYISIIHPKAVISKHSVIEDGTVVMAGAVLNPHSRIGKHCIVNTGAIIEHDCIVSDFAHISPNASLAGGVFIGEGTHVGIGACVIQGIKIGKWVTIGAGAVIIKDIPDYAVVVGNPGKIIKINQENE